MRNVWVFIFLSLLACAEEKPEMEMDIAPWNAFVLPGNETICGSSEIGNGPRLRFSTVTLTWDKPEELILVAIQIKVPAKGLLTADISCTISGDELDYIFGLTQSGVFSSAPTEAYRDSAKTQLTNRYCALKCFGIGVDLNQDKGFSATGTAKVTAFKIHGDGTQEPVSAITGVSVTYRP